MNRLTPNVRKSGRYIIFDSTPDAKTVKNAPRQKTRAMPHDDVHAVALQRMPRRGRGRPPVNEIRGYYSIQFGQYQGQTFRWLVENDMGYVTQLLVQVEKEGGNTGGGSLNDNKRQLKYYVESFPEGRAALEQRREETKPKVRQTVPTATVPASSSEADDYDLLSQVEALEASQPKQSSVSHDKTKPTTISTLLEKTKPTSAEKTKQTSVEKTKPTSAEKTKQTSVEKTKPTSAEKTKPTSAEKTKQTSVEKTKPTSAEKTKQTSVEKTKPTSAEKTKPTSAEKTKQTSAEKTKQTSVEKTKPTSAEKTKPTSAEKTKQTSAEKTKPTSAEKTKPSSAPVTIETPTQSQAEKSLSVTLSQIDEYPLPKGWKTSIPEVDRKWISKALCKYNQHGVLEVQPTQLWYHPPQPHLIPSQPPNIDRYFAHSLFVWMPKKLWRVKLHCILESCNNREVVRAGNYPVVRQVMNITSFYLMVAEIYECGKCKAKYVSWSGAFIKQLDVSRRCQFPVILTYRYACDESVVTLLRTRGLGNSPFQLQRKLQEQHHRTWTKQTTIYLSDYKGFTDKSLAVCAPPVKPPPPQPVPKYKWLQKVYCLDVMSRIDEVKASITSVFGRILKMDSTKKVAKKLAGASKDTATWATNVGNEDGQVLMSVLTCQEGYLGLTSMIDGIIQRYTSADVQPPEVLYVDKECCGESCARKLFDAWPDLKLRLDIWHFMRRFTAGCSTDAHQLYGVFMSRLSKCIYKWSSQDLKELTEAKRSELKRRHLNNPSEDDVLRWLSKRELALHCRRQTRGSEETTRLIDELLEGFMGDQGLDTLGVPLFDNEKMLNIWETQKKHVPCIQDPEGVSLYTQTGTCKKGDVVLPKYRCARGSVSLESFHNHLAKFIPGTTASDTHFQAYLLDGLKRWNDDRMHQQSDKPSTISYSGLERYAVNELSQSVLNERLIPEFQPPRKYTGEKIGVEYLLSQTGKVLQDIISSTDTDNAALARQEEAEAATEEEEEDQDEGFGDDPEDDPTLPSLEPEELRPPQQQTGQRAPVERKQSTGQRDPVERQQSTGQRDPVERQQSTGQRDPVERQQSKGQRIPAAGQQSSSVSRAKSTPQASSSVTPARPASSGGKRPARFRSNSPDSSDSEASRDPEWVPDDDNGANDDDDDDDGLGESVDPDNIGGYDKVNKLADYLFSLREQKEPLSNHQALQIMRLWNNLSEFDKKPTVPLPRHKARLTTGSATTFKVRSKSTCVPGVDSVKRAFHGSEGGVAQRPDSNRYMELLIIKLCEVHPSPVKVDQKRIDRWNLVGRDYRHIRELISMNPLVNKVTLYSINNATLLQWYNKRTKTQDREMLERNITMAEPKMTSDTPVPAAQVMVPVTERPPVPQDQQHTFTLPPYTVGTTGRVKRQLIPSETPANPESDFQRLPINFTGIQVPQGLDPIQQLIFQPVVPQLGTPVQPMARTTEWYKRKKQEKKASGQTIRENKVRREIKMYTCSKCKQPRDKENHPTQVQGKWYCRLTATESLEEFLARNKPKENRSRKRKLEPELAEDPE